MYFTIYFSRILMINIVSKMLLLEIFKFFGLEQINMKFNRLLQNREFS